jgi:hypothetical protein
MATPIKIYKVEQDNGDGRIQTSLSFSPADFRRIRDRNTGMVLADVMDGGCIGAILAPEGSEVEEVTVGGEAVFTPGSFFGISAGEAWDLAKRGQMGFRFPG